MIDRIFCRSGLLDPSLNRAIGHAKVLSVNGGDVVSIDTKYYFTSGSFVQPASIVVQDVLTQLASIFFPGFGTSGISGEEQIKAETMFTQNVPFTDFLSSLFSESLNNYSDKPLAFLTYIMLDKEFNMIPEATGVLRAENPDQLSDLAVLELKIPKDGFLYIYVSNQSTGKEVSFDNLDIEHVPGSVLEENHYYPYGLLIEQLSSKNPNFVSQSNQKYQSKQLRDELSMNMLDFGARQYDAVLGRWIVQDPMRQYSNPYVAMGNNPSNMIDPSGMYAVVEDCSGIGSEVLPGTEGLEHDESPATGENISAEGLIDIIGDLYEIDSPGGAGYNVALNSYFTFSSSFTKLSDGGIAVTTMSWNEKDKDGNSKTIDGTSGVASLEIFDAPIKENNHGGGSFAGSMGEPGNKDFSGFLGGLNYIWTGGNIDGIKYNMDGQAIGRSPIMGLPPIPSFNKIPNLSKMSTGLKALFKDGVRGNSIINIRNVLLNNGFTQTLTKNKSGYLFTNNAGEQVRLMLRNGSWDVRMLNQYGNYLDDIGNVASPANSHGILIFSR